MAASCAEAYEVSLARVDTARIAHERARCFARYRKSRADVKVTRPSVRACTLGSANEEQKGSSSNEWHITIDRGVAGSSEANPPTTVSSYAALASSQGLRKRHG